MKSRLSKDDIKNIIVIALVQNLLDHDGMFLFVKEEDGALRFPGGKVKRHETLKQAIQRELMEETGIETIAAANLSLIEHAIEFDRHSGIIEKSILLYFFEIGRF